MFCFVRNWQHCLPLQQKKAIVKFYYITIQNIALDHFKWSGDLSTALSSVCPVGRLSNDNNATSIADYIIIFNKFIFALDGNDMNCQKCEIDMINHEIHRNWHSWIRSEKWWTSFALLPLRYDQAVLKCKDDGDESMKKPSLIN